MYSQGQTQQFLSFKQRAGRFTIQRENMTFGTAEKQEEEEEQAHCSVVYKHLICA